MRENLLTESVLKKNTYFSFAERGGENTKTCLNSDTLFKADFLGAGEEGIQVVESVVGHQHYHHNS